MRINWLFLLTGIALVLVLYWVSRLDMDTTTVEARQYCRMVALFKQSGPDVGWPDYNGTFDEQCTPDGRLRDE